MMEERRWKWCQLYLYYLLDGDVAPHGELDGALEARDDEERVVVLVVHGELLYHRQGWQIGHVELAQDIRIRIRTSSDEKGSTLA